MTSQFFLISYPGMDSETDSQISVLGDSWLTKINWWICTRHSGDIAVVGVRGQKSLSEILKS